MDKMKKTSFGNLDNCPSKKSNFAQLLVLHSKVISSGDEDSGYSLPQAEMYRQIEPR